MTSIILFAIITIILFGFFKSFKLKKINKNKYTISQWMLMNKANRKKIDDKEKLIMMKRKQ